jgi:hypothetical protein
MTDSLADPTASPAPSTEATNPSPTWTDSADVEDDDDDDATIISDPVVTLKEYSIQSQFRLPKQKVTNPMPLFINLATEMMRHDPHFKITVYDCIDANELWPLASAKDLPATDDIAQRYFVNTQFNQQRTSVSVIFRVISQHSHVKWRQIMSNYLATNRILLKQHKIDALDTTCIGFLARKHPHYTHLNHFETYLRDTLPDTTPQFHLRHLKPRIPAGFAEAVQTEVIGIQTSKEHASRLNDIFNSNFPVNTDDREFFVSFRAGLDDDKLRSLYRLQNKWLAQVKIIRIGAARNIDVKVNVGLPQPVSLREFIRDKPKEPSHINLAMDVDNGGRSGKPVLIVLPKNMSAAEAIYDDFRQSADTSTSPSTNPASHDSRSSTFSSRDPAYDAKIADFLAHTYLSDSDIDDSVSTSTTPASQQYLKAPHPTNRTNRSIMKSHGRRRSGRSYAVAAAGSPPSSEPPVPPNRSTPTMHSPPSSRASPPTHHPPIVQVDTASSVSTITNAQQSALLLEMHSMLKEQRHEIKKLKKRNELSKRTTINLQNRIDSICNSLDELSRRTMDSDFSSADLSSALSMASSQARTDDSSDTSLDSTFEPDKNMLPTRPSSLRFTKPRSHTFGVNDPPAEIRARHLPKDISHHSPTSRNDPPSATSPSTEWSSPKKTKSHTSSFKPTANTPRPPVSNNPFSPLADDYSHSTTPTLLSSLGRTRSPSKTPASKKLRSSSDSSSDTFFSLHDVNMPDHSSTPQPSSIAYPLDHDMTAWDHNTASPPVLDDLPMNESVD